MSNFFAVLQESESNDPFEIAQKREQSTSKPKKPQQKNEPHSHQKPKWKTETLYLPVYEYDKSSTKWRETYTPELTTNNNNRTSSLSVLTYNVWFSMHHISKRFIETSRLLSQHLPQVICLQEVTSIFLFLLCREPWCRDHYILSDSNGTRTTFQREYGVLILIRKDVQFEKLQLNTLLTTMGRACITVSLTVNDQPVQISTVHLESLNSNEYRAHQLTDICTNVLTTGKTTILAGDFNFDDERNFNPNELPIENEIFDRKDSIVSEYTDVWRELHPGVKGKTFDSTVNTMIRKHEVMRYDRVIYRSKDNSWKAKSIEIIGDKPFKTKDRRGDHLIFPSDHFGLVAVFDCMN